MAKIPEQKGARYVSTRGVTERYDDISLRTLRRWLLRGVIPPPDLTIHGRKYWRVETLEQNDRQRTMEAADRRPVGQFANRHELAAAK